MARNSNSAIKQTYKEFAFKGKEINYTGRAYPESKKSTDKVDITPFSLTINGVLTIKGCKLFQSDTKTWIGWPQWKDKDGAYKDYVYVDKTYSEEELDKLAAVIEKVIA